jgi:acyl-CoA thioester hydrolase
VELVNGGKALHQISVKIYYEDTDAGGIVYYGNYLRYLERARTEFLLDHGISVVEFHQQGLFFAVTHVEIHYKRPARLGETINITTEIAEMKNASTVLRSLIFRNNVLLVEAYVTFACIDKEGKPRRLPEDLRRINS